MVSVSHFHEHTEKRTFFSFSNNTCEHIQNHTQSDASLMPIRSQLPPSQAQMLLSDTNIDFNSWNESLDAPPGVEEEREGIHTTNGQGNGGGTKAQDLDVEMFARYMNTDDIPHSIIVDCSRGNVATSDHASWLASGLHVVSGSNQMALYASG